MFTFWIPSTETIAGPKFARLEASPEGVKFGVTVQWWDIILRGQPLAESLTFGSGGETTLLAFQIETSLGRRLAKHSLTAVGLWPGCEHCYGPWTECSLYPMEAYLPPQGMGLAQVQREQDDGIVFTVDLVPDESQHAERPFAPADVPALMEECRRLIAKGESTSIDPAHFVGELKPLNPIRVESSRGAIVLWMGGANGYAISPDRDGCPVFDGVMISGTDLKHIYRLERFRGQTGVNTAENSHRTIGICRVIGAFPVAGRMPALPGSMITTKSDRSRAVQRAEDDSPPGTAGVPPAPEHRAFRSAGSHRVSDRVSPSPFSARRSGGAGGTPAVSV